LQSVKTKKELLDYYSWYSSVQFNDDEKIVIKSIVCNDKKRRCKSSWKHSSKKIKNSVCYIKMLEWNEYFWWWFTHKNLCKWLLIIMRHCIKQITHNLSKNLYNFISFVSLIKSINIFEIILLCLSINICWIKEKNNSLSLTST
jgi:hypothetical protein